MKQKRKYPYPFPHLEFACLFVKVFQGISGVLYYRFVSFKFHSLTTTFYVSLFTKSAQKILQRIIKFLFFYLLLRMISFWCSVSTRFFFGEGAILTYSYRQEILTSNYIIMSLLFSGEMVTESITIILVMCTLVTSIVVTCHWNGQHSLTDIDQPGHRRRTWTAAIFSSHAYWPGNF